MALIHLRVLGYLVTLFLHLTNLTMLQVMKNEELSSDIMVKTFRKMLYRYFTCWTVMLQILYASFGLYCDVKVLTNSNKKYELPTSLRGLRNIMFSALVWPCTWVVFTIFWSLYIYDRSLIFPEFIEQVISNISNHILHTLIIPIVVWEVLCRPRAQPRSHLRNIVQLTVHVVVYLAVMYYTYISEGFWLYPIFDVTYKSGFINFVLLHVCMGVLFILFYYMQWWLTYIVHGSQVTVKNKIK